MTHPFLIWMIESLKRHKDAVFSRAGLFVNQPMEFPTSSVTTTFHSPCPIPGTLEMQADLLMVEEVEAIVEVPLKIGGLDSAEIAALLAV